MIQIFGTTKNFDTKKAQMWFKERRIPFQFVDLKEKEMSRGEFESVVESVSRAAGSRAEAVELLANPKIVRNRLKIKASISNARIFRAVCLEYGSFFNFIKKFLDEYLCKTACAKSRGMENAENIAEKAALSGIKIIHETGRSTNGLSDAISAELKKRGMKFMGSTIVYSFLQAIGVIFSHEEGCFLFRG